NSAQVNNSSGQLQQLFPGHGKRFGASPGTSIGNRFSENPDFRRW
ncbi:3271_t:CDS:1, partial [Dentiscutata heterogama]